MCHSFTPVDCWIWTNINIRNVLFHNASTGRRPKARSVQTNLPKGGHIQNISKTYPRHIHDEGRTLLLVAFIKWTQRYQSRTNASNEKKTPVIHQTSILSMPATVNSTNTSWIPSHSWSSRQSLPFLFCFVVSIPRAFPLPIRCILFRTPPPHTRAGWNGNLNVFYEWVIYWT